MIWLTALEAVLRTVSALLPVEYQNDIALLFDLRDVYGAESPEVEAFAEVMKTAHDTQTPVPQATLDSYMMKLDANDARFAALRERIAARGIT